MKQSFRLNGVKMVKKSYGWVPATKSFEKLTDAERLHWLMKNTKYVVQLNKFNNNQKLSK